MKIFNILFNLAIKIWAIVALILIVHGNTNGWLITSVILGIINFSINFSKINTKRS